MTDDGGFRDLFDEVGDLFDSEPAYNFKPSHLPLGHVAHGWYCRCRRSLAAALHPVSTLRAPTDRTARPDVDRADGYWVARRASAVGVVCVNWQQVCLGAAAAGRSIDVWVTEQVLQCYDGDQLLRTQVRQRRGEVRKKRASIPGGRPTLKSSVADLPK